MTWRDTVDTAFAAAFTLLLVFVLLVLAGCVTRVTTCVEYGRGVGRPTEYGRPDSASASVCADVERP